MNDSLTRPYDEIVKELGKAEVKEEKLSRERNSLAAQINVVASLRTQLERELSKAIERDKNKRPHA